jgi:hypothetical protein
MTPCRSIAAATSGDGEVIIAWADAPLITSRDGSMLGSGRTYG